MNSKNLREPDSRAPSSAHELRNPSLYLSYMCYQPILFLSLAAALVVRFDTGAPFENPSLLLWCNTFFFLVLLVVSAQFSRSFYLDGSPGLLLLACGACLWGGAGFAGVVSGFETHPVGARLDGNVLSSIYTICVWVSAMLHLTAVILSSLMNRTIMTGRGGWIAGGYGMALLVGIVIVHWTATGSAPRFFEPGSGGTTIRQFLLASSIAMFLLTAMLLRTRIARSSLPPAVWYENALLLMSLGLICSWLQENQGSLLNWYGRGVRYLAGLAMLVAAVLAHRGMTWKFSSHVADGERCSSFANCILSAAIIAAGVLVTGSVQLLLQEPSGYELTFLAFLPAVMFSVLLGGRYSGLSTSLVSCVLVVGWNIGVGRYHVLFPSAVRLDFFLFLGASLGVTMLADALQRKRGELVAVGIRLHHAALRQQDADALKESEERLQSIIEATNAGTWDWNVRTGETVFNERWAQMAGYTLEELEPVSIATWENLVHPDDLQRSNELLRQVFSGVRPVYDCECRMRHRNGHWIWVHDRGKVVEWDENGGPLRMTGSHTEISARKQTEATLLENERNLRNLVESTSDLIVVASLEGKILFANGNLTRKLGFSADELASMGVLDLHPPLLRREAGEIFSAMLRGEREMCPLPILTKEGGAIPVETRVWKGSWNGLVCLYGFIRDLTEDQEMRQRFEALFRHSPVIMAITSISDRVFLDVNDAFVETLGYSRQDVLGRTADELGLFVHPGRQRKSRSELERERRIKGHLHQVYHKDGSILHGLFSGEVVRTPERQYHVTAMIDLTSRVRAEEAIFRSRDEAEKAMMEKTRLLSVIAHEFRTPLAVLNSSLDILERYKDRLTESDRQLRERHIRSALSQLTSLVDVSQSYNWLQNEPRQSRLEEVDVGLFFREVALEAETAWAKNHHFTLRLEPSLSTMRSDKGLLRAILVNLLANSFKYTPAEGSIGMSVISGKGVIRIVVEDSGIGIPSEELKTIFRPFIRGGNVGSIRGMGLGLNIVSMALDKLGGTLEVISKEGRGTMITLFLPVSTERNDDAPEILTHSHQGQ